MDFHTLRLLAIKKINFTLIHILVLLIQMKNLQESHLTSQHLLTLSKYTPQK